MATAPDITLSKQLEDFLRCSICKEPLTEPRTLGCFHSFCKKCLTKHVESQREEAGQEHEHPFNCPLCRTQFQGGSVEQLQPNSFITNLLEMLRMHERASRLACESCRGNVSAICRCVDCEHYLCKNCLSVHKNWPAFKSHVVLTMEELAKPENHAKAKPKARCHKDGHGNKLLEFYCNTCQKLVCMTCVVLDHPQPKHDCQPVDVVAKQHKEELKKTATTLQMKYDESHENALQKIKRASENLQANTKKAKDAILQHEKEILKEFTKQLKLQTERLIVEVERKHNEVNQKIVQQHDEMKAHVEKVKGSLGFAKNIIEKGSNEEVLSFGNEIKANADNIEKKCPKVMRPIHYGFIQYVQKKSSKDVIDKYVDLTNLGEIVESHVDIQSLLACSKILDDNMNFAKQLANWVEDKEFDWKLCYRASRDGWKGIDFHKKCDDVGPTVTLIKCGTNVFGGYTDASWSYRDQLGVLALFDIDNRLLACSKSSNQSFLFSLQNKYNLPPFKCPIYDHKHDEAIYCFPGFGPIFGNDLYISSEANTNQASCSNLGDTYQPPPGYQYGTPQTQALLAGSYNFTPTQIEVFCR